MLAVAFCFFLPFFTASSCEGTVAQASGVQIVEGSRVTYPVDLEIQGVANSMRPWAIAALAALGIGSVLVLCSGLTTRWRLARAASGGIALVALGSLFGCMDPPRGSYDYSSAAGLKLAMLTLIGMLIRDLIALQHEFEAREAVSDPNHSWTGALPELPPAAQRRIAHTPRSSAE